MTPHRITKSFKGSQDGHTTEHFEAGTVRPLSPALAAIVVQAGWAEEHTNETAQARDTKVIAPEEFKDEKKKKAKG